MQVSIERSIIIFACSEESIKKFVKYGILLPFTLPSSENLIKISDIFYFCAGVNQSI